MTDRDHFAASALSGMLARESIDDDPLEFHFLCEHAYKWADAMLRERSRSVQNATGGGESDAKCTGRDSASCRAGGDCPGQDNAPNHDAAPVPEHEWKSAYENMQRASLRLYAKIRDIADDVCGIGSGVTVSTHHAPEWLDAIASEYHRVRIELEQLRAKTNHDAAPAARATADRYVCRAAADGDSDRTDKAAPRPSEGTGDTPVTEPMPAFLSGSGFVTPISYADSNAKPVAWGVVYPNDEVAVIAFKRNDAEERATASDSIVPLYRHPLPTLTDEEREAIAYFAVIDGPQYLPAANEAATTLRVLLERLGATNKTDGYVE